jgi:class 3 adenylate cyclase/tetratricopeptide (TPR) repeat protein
VPSASEAVAERRLVTVLFADLVGFTLFAEARDAEEVRETLSRYFALASDVIARYGGTVEKFIGDAVMAVWGTPTAHEDDAERAVRAALELVDAVPGVAAGTQARAGLLTGEAVVTLGATNQGMVAGDLVNTASRLQSVALPGAVLVGETTYRAASKAIVFAPAGDQAVKGKTASVPAWRAVRVVAEVGGRNRSETLEAPFVGREAELRLLKDMLHATGRERRARLMSITGIAGIGKSRLAWEFEKYLDGVVEPVRWHAGRSPSYGEGMTFWALGEMVRSRAGLLESEDHETTRQKVAASVEQWLPDESERQWVEGALLALLGVDDPPAGGREALFAAWRTYFERIAAQGTVAMVFEDLHWADAGLLDFIDHMLEWSRDFPIYIVTLARPELLERRADWGAGKRSFTSIGLEPLDGKQMGQLLAGLVPGLPDQATKAILARAEGIPLYAVEMVRVLVADGRLVEADGVYRPVGDLGAISVPETLHALIAARLDSLEPGDRSLLQDAAVLGQSFTPASLSAITATSAEELEPRLRALARKEILAHKVDPRSPERGQYSFVQALIREVAYNTLARPERKARHLAAARWFESLGEDELAGALAAHYLAAHASSAAGPEADALAGQARIALRVAGDRAAGLGSYEQALTFYDQALTVGPNLVERIELLERAAEAATSAGRHEEAEKRARESVEIEQAEGNRPGMARSNFLLGQILLNGYRSDDALRLLEEVYADLSDLRGSPEYAALGSQLARAHFFNEQNARAVEVADLVLEVAEHANLIPIVADTLVTKGAALCNLGRSYEGLGTLRAAHEMAAAHELTSTRYRAVINLVGYLSTLDPMAGFQTAHEALAHARRLGHNFPIMIVNYAGSAQDIGEWDRALEATAEALQMELDYVDWIQIAVAHAALVEMRGEPDPELLERMEATDHLGTWQAVESHLVESHLDDAAAYRAMVRGDLAGAREKWLAQAKISALNAPTSLVLCAHLALWERDDDAARSAVRMLDETGQHGPALDTRRRALGAGLLALEGRKAEAAAEYRDALRRLRELSLVLEEGFTGMDMLSVLGPHDPDARRAGERSREIFEGLRAKALLALLEPMMAEPDGGAVPPAATARLVEEAGSALAS